MAAVTTIVEGNTKFREGKKWKSRWCVIKKPSPVADHLQVFLYKNVCEATKQEGKCKSAFTLDSYFGLDASVSYDREPNVLAIVCEKNVFLFAFEQREDMIQFEIKIRQSLGEEHHFLVKVLKAPSSSKIPKDQLNLIIHDTRFCLTSQSPPKILLSWNIIDLRRYGLRDGKFGFEGGANCGKGAGLFALQSDQIEMIADIIHFAATGKMSNCHRKFKNRSSQIDLGSHLITDIPSLPSQSSSSHIHHIHHSVAKGPLQGALPATLNCCHDSQTGSAESEDWNWYKRHSVSVMDYRRISALREKSGSEMRDQLAMGIYDIPPNHDRKLDICFPPPASGYGYDHPKSFCLGSEMSASNTLISDKHEYCNTLDPLMEDREGHYKRLKNKNSAIKKNSKESTSFQLDNVDEYQSDSVSRNETLRNLKKQEYNIEKEMRLLDEMLQNCTSHNEETTVHASRSFGFEKSQISKQICKEMPKDLLYANYDLVPAMLKEPESKTPQRRDVDHGESNSFRVVSNKDFEIISGNISPRKTNQNHLSSHNSTPKRPAKCNMHLNKSMPDETPLSPLFHAKLNSIPSGSKLNAPLPYVNLSRYDDDSSSHVHLPGSADGLPVARGSSFSSLNTSRDNHSKGPVVWRQHSGSMSSLPTPVAASSLTNINQSSGFSNSKQHSSQARFQLKQSIEGQSYNCDESNSEILVVNLNGKRELKQKQDKVSISQLVLENGSIGSRCDSELLNLITTDLKHGNKEQERVIKHEGIYENLPLTREETPPPALPPKCPALLKKLQGSTNDVDSKYNHTSLSPSTPQRQNKSFSSFHDSSFGYDNHIGSDIIQRDISMSDMNGQREDNYLHMGSPKTSHKISMTAPVIWPNKKKVGSKLQVRDDYMDMGVAGAEQNNVSDGMALEDEIYLDYEETIKSSKSLPERLISGKSMPLGLPPVGSGSNRESTYIEMATVPTRKSMVIQNLETLHAYVSQKPGGEKGSTAAQTPTASPPSLPRPYKVRHNSDSGLSSRENVDLDVNSEKTKTKGPMKIYTKVKSTDIVNKPPEPPLPFQNLMGFTKKMTDSRSTYVNTYIDAEKNLTSFENDIRSIPLPEPVKEGFLARFKRRSSRDKGSPAPDKTGGGKNRSNALERSMSEHDSPKSNKEEKYSKLKIGRRRSSSFPNRLSYQEAQDEDSHAPTVKKMDSSSSGFSSGSAKTPFNPPEQSESLPSMQDYSDDSDISPLLKRGGRKIIPNTATILHVQQNHPFDKSLYMHTSRSTSCLISQIPNSSKTDDEKLSEILFKGRSLKDSFDDSSYHDISFEKNQKHGMSIENKARFSHLPQCPALKFIQESTSEYCLMDPPKHEKSAPFSVSVEAGGDSLPPALPPKSRNYQNLLSPVLETTPPVLPPRPCVDVISLQTEPDVSEEMIMDQYVELSRSFGSQDKAVGIKTSLDSKAGRPSNSSTSEETLNTDQKFATITLPVEGDKSDLEMLSTHSYILDGNSSCTSPAKSILRPRTGQEYVVVQRVTLLPNFRLPSPSATSLSSVLGHVFNYDLASETTKEDNSPSQKLSEYHCHLNHQGSCECIPKSQKSPPAQHVPQRSPSLASDSDTIRSNLSMFHDQIDTDKSIQNQNCRTRLTSLSVSTLSSPSPSPKSGISFQRMSPQFNSPDLSAKLTPAEFGARVFFPDEASISTTFDSTPCDHSYLQDEDYHVYVNQEFVFMHQHQNSGKNRTGSSFNSHLSASPHMTGMHSRLSLFRDTLQSKRMSDAPVTPKGSRERSRHSESDTGRAKQISHSFGPADRHHKSLTLPPSVHRSHSDPKRILKAMPFPSHSQSNVHQKKFDKFAQSSIIARRRQQTAPVLVEPYNQDSIDGSQVSQIVFNSSPGLQVPQIRSSGYKNIDTMKAFSGLGNDIPHQNSTPSPDVLELQLSPGYSDTSYLSCNSYPVFTSTPTPTSKSSISPLPVTPPPLPPRRISTPSTISPPLTPHTCGSDSPPPYLAPPPPLLPKEALSPALKSDSFISSSSEDEQELIYIEVDMTKKQDDMQRTPSLPLSRRSRRAKQQRDLVRMRYAEIDHTATKALKETSEKFRDDWRSMGGSSVIRKNSSVSSKHRKSPLQVSYEHQLSTASIESC